MRTLKHLKMGIQKKPKRMARVRRKKRLMRKKLNLRKMEILQVCIISMYILKALLSLTVERDVCNK